MFKQVDLGQAVRCPMIVTHKSKGKFQPKWEGPFVVESLYSNGAYRLAKLEGEVIMAPINDKFLKTISPLKNFLWGYQKLTMTV